jgi:hypothetical protein
MSAATHRQLAPLGRHGEVPVTVGGKSKPDYAALSLAASSTTGTE